MYVLHVPYHMYVCIVYDVQYTYVCTYVRMCYMCVLQYLYFVYCIILGYMYVMYVCMYYAYCVTMCSVCIVSTVCTVFVVLSIRSTLHGPVAQFITSTQRRSLRAIQIPLSMSHM